MSFLRSLKAIGAVTIPDRETEQKAGTQPSGRERTTAVVFAILAALVGAVSVFAVFRL